MIALLLAQALLGTLPRQQLPVQGCAAYLWTVEPQRRLVAAATAVGGAGGGAGTLRLVLDGRTLDLARSAAPAPAPGQGSFGFDPVTEYRAGAVTATLDLTIRTRADLSGGALVPEAAVRIDRPGRDSVVQPLAGLVGCAPAG